MIFQEGKRSDSNSKPLLHLPLFSLNRKTKIILVTTNIKDLFGYVSLIVFLSHISAPVAQALS